MKNCLAPWSRLGMSVGAAGLLGSSVVLAQQQPPQSQFDSIRSSAGAEPVTNTPKK